jgi:hypothetical protein
VANVADITEDQMLEELRDLGQRGLGERSALWAIAEIERLRREVKQAEYRSFQGGRISYMGFNYGVNAQAGVDSLRRAIVENGHG